MAHLAPARFECWQCCTTMLFAHGDIVLLTSLVLRRIPVITWVCASLLRTSNEPPKPPPPIDDSTSALDYKSTQKIRPPPLPVSDVPRSRSAEEAVTNILYNTPPPNLQPYK
ncbi:hypothetical protein OG21DRAFT_1607932, partial [Imleria badia]